MECRKPQKRKNLRLLILTTNPSKPGHDVAGLFFCLASAEGAGLLFCPAAIQPNTSVYSVFCAVNANYTAHAIKRHTGLCSGISGYLPYSTATDNRPIQAVIIPHTPRWSVSQRRSASSEYQIPAPRRTLYRTAQPPYYNKVYKSAPLLWIHASPAGQSSGVRRGTTGGSRRISFRAFAR